MSVNGAEHRDSIRNYFKSSIVKSTKRYTLRFFWGSGDGPALSDLNAGFRGAFDWRSKPFTPGKTRVQLVPPLDAVVLAELPAEEHYAAIAVGGEIDQPTLIVL